MSTDHSKYHWKLLLTICIFAAFFRLWGAFDLHEFIEDEELHVTDAIAIANYGTTANWGWHHPQMSGFIMYGTIKLFGNNPVGWRSSNIMFSVASLPLLFLIGRNLYPKSAAPLLAAALLAFDPHNIYISRTTFVEIPVTFFFLLYLYLLLEYCENSRNTLLLAGIAAGFTIATKAYFALAIPLAAIYALFRKHQKGELHRSTIIDFIATLIVLPISVYLFSYLLWFGRGHNLIDLFTMKSDGIWALKQLKYYINQTYLEAGGKPWEWFVKPLFWGNQRLTNADTGRFLIQTNNIPFRIFVFPALLGVTLFGIKKRLPREMLAPLLFAACYLLFILAERPMFSYSSTVILPFAYLALARGAELITEKSSYQLHIFSGILIASLLWAAYLFPVISAQVISIAPYRLLLHQLRFLGNF